MLDGGRATYSAKLGRLGFPIEYVSGSTFMPGSGYLDQMDVKFINAELATINYSYQSLKLLTMAN